MNCPTWYELVNNLIGTTIASLAMYFVCSPRAGAGLGEVKLILQQHAPRMISPPWRRFWRFIDIVSETGKKGGGTRKRRWPGGAGKWVGQVNEAVIAGMKRGVREGRDGMREGDGGLTVAMAAPHSQKTQMMKRPISSERKVLTR